MLKILPAQVIVCLSHIYIRQIILCQQQKKIVTDQQKYHIYFHELLLPQK